MRSLALFLATLLLAGCMADSPEPASSESPTEVREEFLFEGVMATGVCIPLPDGQCLVENLEDGSAIRNVRPDLDVKAIRLNMSWQSETPASLVLRLRLACGGGSCPVQQDFFEGQSPIQGTWEFQGEHERPVRIFAQAQNPLEETGLFMQVRDGSKFVAEGEILYR